MVFFPISPAESVQTFLYAYDVKEHKHVYFLFIYIPRYVYTNVGGCVMIKVQ